MPRGLCRIQRWLYRNSSTGSYRVLSFPLERRVEVLGVAVSIKVFASMEDVSLGCGGQVGKSFMDCGIARYSRVAGVVMLQSERMRQMWWRYTMLQK